MARNYMTRAEWKIIRSEKRSRMVWRRRGSPKTSERCAEDAGLAALDGQFTEGEDGVHEAGFSSDKRSGRTRMYLGSWSGLIGVVEKIFIT